MAKFTILQGPVEHDGKLLEEGAVVDLKAEAADVLVALGVVEPAGKAPAPPAPAEG